MVKWEYYEVFKRCAENWGPSFHLVGGGIDLVRVLFHTPLGLGGAPTGYEVRVEGAMDTGLYQSFTLGERAAAILVYAAIATGDDIKYSELVQKGFKQL